MSCATGYEKEYEASTSSSIQLSQQCRHFQLFDILLATENFDESLVIGRGGFGKVYRGTIFNGSATVRAAIKRLDPNSNQGAPEFWAEVEMLSRLRHCNLVSLFGYCNDEEEMILVYEYMPNGTLEDHLHKLGTPLSWVQRLKICIDAGRGLHYLHTGTGIDVGVIHRDVKTSNILLQESWAAKISDFGLSKIGPTNQPMTYVKTIVKGTFGYFDPNYYATGNLTRKSDVYAFGVVLLEVLCRKYAVFYIDGEASNLANWAQESIKEGNFENIVDFDIRGQIYPECLKEFIRIAESCLHGDPKQRCTMAEVMVSLENVLVLQEKFNNSVQTADRTILDRMVNMHPFPSNRDNTANGDSNLSSNGEGIVTKISNSGQAALGWVDSTTFIPSAAGVGTAETVKKQRGETFQGHAELLESAEVNFFSEYGEGSRYKFEKVIGKGSSGVVCSAYDTHLGKRVAIKKIRDIFQHVAVATGVLREIKLLSLLPHPNIVEIKNILLPPSRRKFKDIYLVFEIMDCDLCPVIKANADLTPEHHRFFLYQLLRGLKYLHTGNVFHRDLKPENILANANSKLKICDFGLARVAFSDQPTTIFWTDYVGSRWYRAPELCGTFYSKYTRAVDIWSIGCIFAELLTGKPLFPGRSIMHQLDLMTDLLGTPSADTISRIENKKARHYLKNMRRKMPIPFSQKFRNVDTPALRLLERMISFDPKQRPTAEEALSDPYFKNLADVDKEPSLQPIKGLEFEFERRKTTEEDIRELIYREILNYHPDMLRRYLDGDETSDFMNTR